MTERPPLPPFTRETAIQKIRAAEDAWNSRDPERCAGAYTPRVLAQPIHIFLRSGGDHRLSDRQVGARARDRLIKELWAFTDDRIAVRFAYEWHSDAGQWFRAYGNENWEFTAQGLMAYRHASINDVPIEESERKFRWDRSGPRPAEDPRLSELGL